MTGHQVRVLCFLADRAGTVKVHGACSCGWRGPTRDSDSEADVDARAHRRTGK